MIDLSILIPSIRTVNWNLVLTTLKEACKRYSYEVVFVGPFDPPANVDMTGCKYIKTYANPSVAAQIGAIACEGKLMYHTVDDAKFVPDSIDRAIDLYNSTCGYKDIVNCRYTEDDDYRVDERNFPPAFWTAHYHPPLRLAGIPGNYKLALHFLINHQYFIEIGGIDTSYFYLNFNLHDLVFRQQYDGGKIYDSPTSVTNCNHYGNGRIDHQAIEDVYPADYQRFLAKYNNPHALRDNPIKIDINNWKNQPEIWEKRFSKKLYKTYEEMIGGELPRP